MEKHRQDCFFFILCSTLKRMLFIRSDKPLPKPPAQ